MYIVAWWVRGEHFLFLGEGEQISGVSEGSVEKGLRDAVVGDVYETYVSACGYQVLTSLKAGTWSWYVVAVGEVDQWNGAPITSSLHHDPSIWNQDLVEALIAR